MDSAANASLIAPCHEGVFETFGDDMAASVAVDPIARTQIAANRGEWTKAGDKANWLLLGSAELDGGRPGLDYFGLLA